MASRCYNLNKAKEKRLFTDQWSKRLGKDTTSTGNMEAAEVLQRSQKDWEELRKTLPARKNRTWKRK